MKTDRRGFIGGLLALAVAPHAKLDKLYTSYTHAPTTGRMASMWNPGLLGPNTFKGSFVLSKISTISTGPFSEAFQLRYEETLRDLAKFIERSYNT